MSSMHLTVQAQPNGILIADMRSTNGSLLKWAALCAFGRSGWRHPQDRLTDDGSGCRADGCDRYFACTACR